MQAVAAAGRESMADAAAKPADNPQAAQRLQTEVFPFSIGARSAGFR
jgi:hypothetical protein